ncbi:MULTISPECIES: RrF2 family transcriptional regulator [Marinobacter]|jgi:Rrf2 family transcriptional regulator, nitric oxide-sensitive transcriptional repressor|uniref:RrF2 family transcriptional regulator n=1 Tax=Marinobacter TaxID=2742 RepID=UPI0009491BA6|nr:MULTISPECIES: Rrf2 family transcriptional regulator [Marinobacter]AZR40624.1 protein aau3 [Marinobacter salarius]MCC4284228.1 Rrf2 family transcriptional regulator [Marinobacter salarius]MCZ4284140.1 Rrf2 family transcriptional regulator [Marinobacter salarius]MDC8454625.1 Rrf2 family transcriptional regulator [Marinobacter sp. DS40M6]MDM8178984.1 Rrf2 family transcriptional regulator [Marinobacter salarius]|tara:strand:- start:291 stop:728 length:438 start_codon:yes stop_codon:yes gene_type:complete
MHITRYTDYSLRVLIYLALQQERLVTIQQIADSYDISKNHLMKVVHQLTLKGYIESVRGKNGGLRLHRRPEDINIGVLVRETEQDMNLVECFSSDNQCCITPVCGLKNILAEALRAFLNTLDQYTLADILTERQKPQLLRLLQIA